MTNSKTFGRSTEELDTVSAIWVMANNDENNKPYHDLNS